MILRLSLFFLFACSCAVLQAGGRPTAFGPEEIQAAWEHEDSVRRSAARNARVRKVTKEQDAQGGVDGFKDGTWGFHTQREKNPWWQVDLGKLYRIGKILLYNRCDACGSRNRFIEVYLSEDGRRFERVYRHSGRSFFGFTDGKPLEVSLGGKRARYVRLALKGVEYLHLDEVEVYPADSLRNVALGKPATQSSTSRWSTPPRGVGENSDFLHIALERGRRLAESLRRLGVHTEPFETKLSEAARKAADPAVRKDPELRRKLYRAVRWTIRRMAFSNPLLDFDTLLFVKRAPGMLPHMSDQYYGWWARPGGGIYLLHDFKSARPRCECLTDSWPRGSFLRPDISYDGKRVLFAYSRYSEGVWRKEKVHKERLPEESFYHLFELDLETRKVRRLTRGRYDDFDGRYLPDGRIVFLSTRKGCFVQYDRKKAALTLLRTCPDSYVRCGGDNRRPCAVFTLHVLDPRNGSIRPISAFENFEWTPSVGADGRVLYARWDYIDRFNGHFMSLWATNPDGSNPQLVYGNFTKKPQCVFEARPIPDSHRLVFTASAHHSITGGSLCLLDPQAGTEGELPITRLTPEVCFPEAEGWPPCYYANPFPFSEQFFLCSWSDRPLPPHAGSTPVRDARNPVNATGIYLYDAFGNLEPLFRDRQISSMYPLPVKPRAKPPVLSESRDEAAQEGRFVVQNVYRGLAGVKYGEVSRIRVVAVVPKTQPHMNRPNLGVSQEDPGKFVLGTVPVEKDGSAYFVVPPDLPVFFQILDKEGFALRTMRTLTYVGRGGIQSCIGCHESRSEAPGVRNFPKALARPPSKLVPDPPGTWPLRFDRLVGPVLERFCVKCHSAGEGRKAAAGLDLTLGKAYDALIAFAGGDIRRLAFEKDFSEVGDMPARKSKLLRVLVKPGGHQGVVLPRWALRRLIVWLDVYAHRRGSFSAEQERRLESLRAQWKDLFLATGNGGER